MASRREHWSELVAEFGGSGESQRNFAKSRGVNLGTFRYWLYRLRAESNSPEKKNEPSITHSGPNELAAEIQAIQQRLTTIEHQTKTNNPTDTLRDLAEDLDQLRQEVFLLSQNRGPGEDAYAAKTEAFDSETAYDYLTFEEQSERELVETLLSDPELTQPLIIEDFNDRLTALETALGEVEDRVGEEARSLVEAGISDYAASLAEAADLSAQQLYNSESLWAELTVEEEAEQQLVGTLLADPPIEEPLLLEDLDQRLTAIEEAWEGLGESGRLTNFNSRLRKLEVALTVTTKDRALQQIERRILGAQERGASMVHTSLTLEVSAAELCASLRRAGYFLSLSNAIDILNQLQVRRILVLQGPPGAGKSRLARLLPQLLIPAIGSTVQFTEASMRPEASSFDVIGGPRPYGKSFGPHLGYLSEAVLRSIEADGKHWLILDEINRGDISAALSTCLDGLNLDVGALSHDYLFMTRSNPRDVLPMPGAFRIIGTMNTFDEDQLFRFSEALSRRIGFVHLSPLTPTDERAIANDLVFHSSVLTMSASKKTPAAFRHDFDRAVNHTFEIIGQVRALAQRDPRHLFRYCEIGTGVLLDVLRHACLRLASNTNERVTDTVDIALASVLLTHLAGRDREVLEALRDDVFSAPTLPHCRKLIDSKLSDIQMF